MSPVSKEQLDSLSERFFTEFRPASSQDLAILKEQNWPESLVEFYSQHEPNADPDEIPDIRFLSIQGIMFESKEMDPSAALVPLGYIPFASTRFGDPFLFDMNSVGPDGHPPVVRASHEEFMGEVTKDFAEQNLKRIADSLADFISKALTNELEG